MSLLEVRQANSFYGDFQALYDVSIAIEAQETVAIIGANGAGKSTLMRMIAGLLPVRVGDIEYDGRPIGALRVHQRVRLGISLVPEGRRIFPSLSVEENLLVGSYARRRGPWTLAKVKELFPILGQMAQRSGAVLSGGEQQALAIGRALMSSPRLMLLDEVSLGLAPVVVRQVYAALPQIVASGTTVLLVEQNIDQALAMSDRVYCLLKGRIVLEGRPANLTRQQITSVYFGI